MPVTLGIFRVASILGGAVRRERAPSIVAAPAPSDAARGARDDRARPIEYIEPLLVRIGARTRVESATSVSLPGARDSRRHALDTAAGARGARRRVRGSRLRR